MPPQNFKDYYDINKRGTESPDYSPMEAWYRSQRFIELTNAFTIREQNHMELNLASYSQYDLTNFQCDLAYNPPKINPADSRIVSGYVREKDLTIDSVIVDMNFQPQLTPFNKNDRAIVDAAQIFTAKIKKVLLQSDFKDKFYNIAHLLVSRGNVFVDINKGEKWHVKKIPLGSPLTNVNHREENLKWRTIYEKVCDYCTIDTLPNTSVFPTNIREGGMEGQSRIYTVRHYPIEKLAQIFKNNPRWASVPKTPSYTVPDIVNGIWGDFYLKLPIQNYGELIVMQSEIYNEYNCWVNGVQMYPIQYENGILSGYPLSAKSPDGRFITCKGDFERIPFFFFSKSNPDKNFVKEEELNEVMRLMVLFLRQKATPPIGNNTDRVLQPDMWNPGMVISDIKKDDISILTPNAGIGPAEFSFWKMLQESIDNTSVSKTLEGQETKDITLGQYKDQKKESLKKLGLPLDRVVELLRQIYWKILDNEISYLDQKVKQYKEDGTFIHAYQSFSIEDSVDGKKGNIQVNLTDDTSDIDTYEEAKKESDMPGLNRTYWAKPGELKEIYKRIRDQMYMDVVSQPEGEQVALLGFLFNTLTQYANLKGGDTKKINFDYLETIIAENSGFDSNKIFLEEPLQLPPTMLPPQPGEEPTATGMIPQNLNPQMDKIGAK